MSKQELESRVEAILKAVEQSAGNHHALLGRLEEARHWLLGATVEATSVCQAVEQGCEIVNEILPAETN